MATLGTTLLTLTDLAKRLDPDSSIAAVIELLNQTNEVLADMPWLEGNLPTGHRTTVRTGLPAVAWRLLNQGVALSKSTTAQIDEACGILEAYSEVDVNLAQLSGNVNGFRLQEAQAFIEAMNEEMCAKLFYGNTALDPKVPLGLSPRYNDLSVAANKVNIIDAGGTQTDNTSIWLVAWGPNTVHGIYPKGSQGGLQHKNLGEDTVIDANGGRFQAYRDHFQWQCGFALRDWRYVVRIANIDVSNLVTESSAADIIKLMMKAIDKLPNQNVGNKVFYMNRTVKTMLGIQALNKSQNAIAVEPAGTQFETRFFGIPIRKVDQILTTESRVV